MKVVNAHPSLTEKLVSTTLATAISLVLASTATYAQTPVAATGFAAQPAELLKSSAKALTEVSVPADFKGAVYIARRGADLYLWEVNEVDSTITLKHIEALNPQIAQTLSIELGRSVTGVFLADDLVQAGDLIRYSLRGELDAGQVAMPRPAEQLSALWSINIVGETVSVSADQIESFVLVETQRKIYQRVTDVMALHQQSAELFALNMQQELSNAYELSNAALASAEPLLEQSEQSTQALVNQFTALAQQDQATIEAQLPASMARVEQQTQQNLAKINQCTDLAKRELTATATRLQNLLIADLDKDDASETLNETHEAAIANTEAQSKRLQSQLEQCLQQPELESTTTASPINELGTDYLAIESQAAQSTANLEVQGESLSELVQARGMAIENQLQDNAIANAMQDYQSYFAEWLSPSYASDEDSDIVPLDKVASTLQSIDALALPGTDPALKAAELLCKNETWNFEFSVGGISVVFATPFNDVVKTGNNSNLIFTFRGHDCVESHAGYDAIFTARGNDKVYAGDDHDFVFAGRDNDEVHGSAGNSYTVTISAVTIKFDIGNLIDGQSGNDTLYGGEVSKDRGEDGNIDSHGYTDLIFGDLLNFGHPAGNDTIVGEMGVDFLFGMPGNDHISNITPGVFTISGVPVPFGSFFFGNKGDDVIIGSNTSIAGVYPLMGDFIFGNSGNDQVQANDGRDFAFGQDDNDNIQGGDHMDFLFGNSGNDAVTGNDGNDFIFGNAGNDVAHGSAGLFDVIFGNTGDDQLYGDDGFDVVFGNQGNDLLDGGNFTDVLFGNDGSDRIRGNDGIDLAFGNSGTDNMFGDDGIDLLFGNSEADNINGGNSFDVVFGNTNEKEFDVLHGDAGTDLLFGNRGRDKVYGDAGIDLVFGNEDADILSGGDGLDMVFGGSGTDIANGDNDPDVVSGGADADSVYGDSGIDLVMGNDGADSVYGGTGLDLLLGNDGDDRIYGGSDPDFGFGNAGNDCMRGESGIDVFAGGGGDDVVRGDSEADLLLGSDGHDFVLGELGVDFVFGGDGNDGLRGDDDADFVFGGQGDDQIDGASGWDLLLGNDGNDLMNSGAGNWELSFGNDGNDRMRAVEDHNMPFGNSGDDVVDGYDSNTPEPRDILFGNGGNDQITGNQWNQKDLRVGGSGSDTKFWNTTLVSAFTITPTGNTSCF